MIGAPALTSPAAAFERVAALQPAAPAIDTGSQQVTYAELRGLVRRVAGRLARLDLAPQSRIGLIGNQELSTYVGYLAILHLGHAVVPFGPDNPLPYQLSVASRAGLAAVLAGRENAQLADALAEAGIAIVDGNDAMNEPVAGGPEPVVDLENVAYILFTSGSTGHPKGVPIKNRHVAEYLSEVVPHHDLGPGARLSHTFALTFDPSVFDILGALTTGSCLVLPRKRELLNPPFYVTSRRLTHWYSVPSLISYAMRIRVLRDGAMPGLRHSMFIGEPLPAVLAQAWQKAAPGSTLENVYGPTELTISCASWVLPAEPADWPATANRTVPIGSVYPSLEWFLWDGADDVGAGEGELCVRGPLRFDGYLDSEHNVGRFVRTFDGGVEVLGEDKPPAGEFWYRTGDRLRVATTVTGPALVHLGRIDRQVKVSGYRIELGDVEGALRTAPLINDAAVVAVSGTDGAFLHAFVQGQADQADVERHLRGVIPPYMIPGRFTYLNALPLNQSGKIDYVRLSAMAEE
ncbi:MAG TPA: AMP-binding protein [Streptosporangiaceae bacterium]|nr:AMP-binding protein [Streptosporangiaceae bacterium]